MAVRLESGPATSDRNFFLLLTVLFLGYFGWCLYDGFYAWPQANLREARKELDRLGVQVDKIQFDEQPIEPDFRMLKQSPPRSEAELTERLGEPDFDKFEEGQRSVYFVSSYGMLKVPVATNGDIDASKASWQTWYKTKDQIGQQFYFLSPIVLALAAYVAFRAVQAMRLKVVIDDDGLHYGARFIPWKSMTALQDYKKKGLCTLVYRQNDQTRTLRLDSYKIAKFEQVVDVIVQGKGFEDPRHVERATNPDEPEPPVDNPPPATTPPDDQDPPRTA